MENIHILIEQIVSDISMQAARLDDVRRQMFVEWLMSHSSTLKTVISSDRQAGAGDHFEGAIHGVDIDVERLGIGLEAWFESLPVQGWLWEYYLILDEIAWWRDLDQASLARILNSKIRD